MVHFCTAYWYIFGLHLTKIEKGNNFITDGLSLSEINCEFIWSDITKINNKYTIDKQYSWLKPIKI